MRAEFWRLVGNTPYHLVLHESTLAAQSLSFGTGGTLGPGSNFLPAQTGACEDVGVVNVKDIRNAIEALITGPLAGQINIGTFPMFLTKNVAMAEVGSNLLENCCILGLHSALNVGSHLQLYSSFEVDTAGEFGPGYTTEIASVVGEAIHDPSGSNPTPSRGAEGQATAGKCQNNFEVGEPLSAGFATPANPWSVAGANGLTYSLQELTFYNWFYGNPNLAEANYYSNNGTLTGHAMACPSGGTGTNGN